MNENTNNAAAIAVAIQLLTSVVEKSFALAEANAERRHQEAMYSLETDRIQAQAQARLANAQASEIEARVLKTA